MASGQDLVKIAQAENGTKENGTNNVKYNTWFYGHEVDGSNYPWCAVFVSWCADKAGITTDDLSAGGYQTDDLKTISYDSFVSLVYTYGYKPAQQ